MVSSSPSARVGSRRCDAPGCENDSVAGRGLVIRPAVGPAHDRPLVLHFCEEHGDVSSLVDRYLAQRTG